MALFSRREENASKTNFFERDKFHKNIEVSDCISLPEYSWVDRGRLAFGLKRTMSAEAVMEC